MHSVLITPQATSQAEITPGAGASVAAAAGTATSDGSVEQASYGEIRRAVESPAQANKQASHDRPLDPQRNNRQNSTALPPENQSSQRQNLAIESLLIDDSSLSAPEDFSRGQALLSEQNMLSRQVVGQQREMLQTIDEAVASFDTSLGHGYTSGLETELDSPVSNAPLAETSLEISSSVEESNTDLGVLNFTGASSNTLGEAGTSRVDLEPTLDPVSITRPDSNVSTAQPGASLAENDTLAAQEAIKDEMIDSVAQQETQGARSLGTGEHIAASVGSDPRAALRSAQVSASINEDRAVGTNASSALGPEHNRPTSASTINMNSDMEGDVFDQPVNSLIKNVQTRQGADNDSFSLERYTSASKLDSAFSAVTESLASDAEGLATQTSQRAQSAEPLSTYSTRINAPFGANQFNAEMNQKIVWLTQANIQSAEIHLNPAELGPIEVKVSVQNDQASLQINAHHSGVREMLESQVQRLRDMLEQNGVQLDQFDVGTQTGGSDPEREFASRQGAGDALENEEQLNPLVSTGSQLVSEHWVDTFV